MGNATAKFEVNQWLLKLNVKLKVKAKLKVKVSVQL
jgi:hypothetical protein